MIVWPDLKLPPINLWNVPASYRGPAPKRGHRPSAPRQHPDCRPGTQARIQQLLTMR